MAKTPMPSPELLRKLLRYNKRTGKLYWRTRTPDLMRSAQPHLCAKWNATHAGKEAFTAIGSHGYFASNISGYGTLLAHRVIVAIVTGKWPESVDHDNRTRTDNRWRNLIPTTHSGNHKNHPINPRNTSGVTGVYRVGQSGKWRAMINNEGRAIRIGDFKQFDDAVAARRAAEISFGFHPNHGRITP